MGWPVVALGEMVKHRKEFITGQPDDDLIPGTPGIDKSACVCGDRASYATVKPLTVQ